jgi:hypothetical protein
MENVKNKEETFKLIKQQLHGGRTLNESSNG